MNPLSALVGGVSSVLGGFMNTSSAQAINSQNLMYAQEQASGQFLPAYYKNLVQGANAAGINPLAALGVSSPGFSFQAQPTNPGAGLMAAGRSIMEVDPYAETLKNLSVEKANIDIANARLAGNNAAQQVARDTIINNQLDKYFKTHRDAVPQGAEAPPLYEQGAGTLNALRDAIDRLGGNTGALLGRLGASVFPGYSGP